MSELDQVKERELEFHNIIFSQTSWEEGPRSATLKYYDTVKNNRVAYTEAIRAYGKGKDILEYGCGSDGYCFEYVHDAKSVSGIDISDVAIEAATEKARSLGLTNTSFAVMDAENMTFPDNSFDVVFGSGILHHLSVEKSAKEIARVLRPGGVAIFTEPMGHNPVINLYRMLTPKLRTPDEHPFLMSDFKILGTYFGRIESSFHNLLATGAVVFRPFPFFPQALRILENLDAFLFRVFPYLKRHAWMSIFLCFEPRK